MGTEPQKEEVLGLGLEEEKITKQTAELRTIQAKGNSMFNDTEVERSKVSLRSQETPSVGGMKRQTGRR